MNSKLFDPTKPVVVSNLSTGPKTEAGKAISSKNSLRHGCCADTLILPTENPADYKSLEATWFKAFPTSEEAEKHLIQELINADWFLQRATRTVANVEAELFALESNPLNWTESQQRSLGRFLRYQTTRANNVKRAQKAVEDFRKSRTAEKLSTQKLITAQTRLKAFEQKHKPEPTFDETIALMRQQAIALGFAPPDPTKR